MKVLLIQPNREFYEGSFDIYGCMERSTLPLGLLYLASAIRERHEVRILDCLMDENTRIYRKGKTLHHSLEWQHIKKHIEDFNPDVLGLTIVFTAQEAPADKILTKIRKHFPRIRIVLGGCAVSVNYEKYLRKFGNTFAIVGEGEKSFPLLLEHLENPGKTKLSAIPNLAYMKNRRLVKNSIQLIEKLDSLRLPSYDLIDMERYMNRRQFLFSRLSPAEKARTPTFFSRRGLKRPDSKRDITMFTSRGCPFSCIFCSVRSQFGSRLRAHSTAYVSRHIRLLAEKYRINHIHFEDDCFALDARRLRSILDTLGKGRPAISWDANLGPASGSLDRETLLRMRRAGCTKLFFAVESGNTKVRDRVLGRRLEIPKIEKALADCRKLGIRTEAFFMTGFPFESKEQEAETLSLAGHLKRYGTEPIIFRMRPEA